ncbi:MAG: DUF58 domain-containing protein [Myxococcales bacterium]|nr:DUF58 domain-containing protein [Myxococcales bacterium]
MAETTQISLRSLWQRWRERRRLRLPRELEFTREGRWFVGLTIGLGIAAINTGNNLLYLILGMLLSLIVLSGILSNLVLRDLRLRRVLPSRVTAHLPTLITLGVTNNKRSAASYSIELEDKIEALEPQRVALQPKKCYFLKVGPKREQRAAYRVSFPRRGRYHLSELKVSTRFPFGLFVKTRRIYVDEELIVWPQLHEVYPTLLEYQDRYGTMSHPQRGTGIDFLALRDMQPGDEVRWIHWPSSASAGKLQVREFENEARPHIHLLVWNVLPDKDAEAWKQLDDAVDLAASLLFHFFQTGHPIDITTAHSATKVIHSEADLSHAMNDLALLPIAAPPQALPALPSPLLIVLPNHATPPTLSVPHKLLRPSNS